MKSAPHQKFHMSHPHAITGAHIPDGAGVRVRIKQREILWSKWPCHTWRAGDISWHGIMLYRHDQALKNRTVSMLRHAPKKRYDNRRSAVDKIFKLPGVSGTWW